MIVVLVLLFLVFPFLMITAMRTTRSLFYYAASTEQRNLELRREKRKSEAILNQVGLR